LIQNSGGPGIPGTKSSAVIINKVVPEKYESVTMAVVGQTVD
jgi:hypothetical protein